MDTIIIGVDCATEPRKVGLALAHLSDEKLVVEDAHHASEEVPPSSIVADWLRNAGRGLAAYSVPDLGRGGGSAEIATVAARERLG